MWLTKQERVILALLGVLTLVGLGMLCWQRQRPPLTVEGTPTAVQATQWDQTLERARRVDVNTADVAELERLPNVGPTLAQRIVEDRHAHGRFQTAEELRRVRGLGPKMLERLKDNITAQ